MPLGAGPELVAEQVQRLMAENRATVKGGPQLPD
jgi:hypothetical protein